MPTPPEQLRARTKLLTILIVRLFRSLPKNDQTRIMGEQVLRAGTSVAANHRAVCRARSRAEFVSKMGVVVEEAAERAFWLEVLIERGIVPRVRMENLPAEAHELWAIFAASYWTARAGGRSGKGQ